MIEVELNGRLNMMTVSDRLFRVLLSVILSHNMPHLLLSMSAQISDAQQRSTQQDSLSFKNQGLALCGLQRRLVKLKSFLLRSTAAVVSLSSVTSYWKHAFGGKQW